MAVQNISRRAGPFTGTGLVSSFPFGFKVFLRSDVQVLRAVSDDIDSPEEILRLDDDYAVTLNADQDENPGGTVTLSAPLAVGLRLAILSNIAADQQVVLTNHDGFLPETLNEVHDKAVALIQELKEETARTLKTPATSEKTPEELTQELLSAQEDARVQADAAARSASEAKAAAELVENAGPNVEKLKQEALSSITSAKTEAVSDIQSYAGAQVDQIGVAGDIQVDRVKATGTSEIQNVVNAVGNVVTDVRDVGDQQVDRIAIAGKAALTQNLHLCGEGKDTVAEAISADTAYTLPEAVEYVVGFDHLLVSVNGLILYKGLQYEEVGAEFTVSTTIKLLMPLAVGDQVEVWVVPVGGNIDVETGIVTPEAGVQCVSESWVVDADKDAGTAVTLPNQMKYVVGKNHLRLSWNGVLLVPLYDFSEIGDAGEESTSVLFSFPLSVADEVNAWTVPYDHAKPDTVDSRITNLEEALADLSRKVVYKDEQSAS